MIKKTKTTSKLTSVKIIKEIYVNFKRETVDTDITLQKFVNRSIDLYLNDSEVKKKIDAHNTCGVKNSKF